MKKPLFLFAAILAVAIYSCTNQKPGNISVQSPIEMTKKAVLKLAEEQGIQLSFQFEAIENDSSLAVVFKNKDIGKQVEIGSRDTSIILGLFSERVKGAEYGAILKSTLIRSDSRIYVEVSDMVEDKIIHTVELPAPTDDFEPFPGGGYDSFQECLEEFMCQNSSKYQCLANEKCENVFAGVLCCLENGSCAWFDFIIFRPNNPRCIFKIEMIDIPVVMAVQ